jgi:hypothetical protein
MDRYVEMVNSLGNFDPHNLPPESLDDTLRSLKRQLLKTEAAKLFLPAKELPFNRVALRRLSSLLKFLFNPEKQQDAKVKTLRSLDSISLIICGLCLTQKVVETMREELFDMCIKQAQIVSQQIINIVAKSHEIYQVVMKSTDDHDFVNSNGIYLRNVHGH